MRNIECADGVVLNHDGQVLVVKNQIGKHTFPKGSKEGKETSEETALREITEESGLIRVEFIQFLGTLVRPGHTAENGSTLSVIKHIDMFHCLAGTVELCPIASDVVSAQWAGADRLEDLLTWPEEFAFFEQHKAALGL
jgi:ADP-ribose pyrophosphatase YjhB (NUDIX family)